MLNYIELCCVLILQYQIKPITIKMYFYSTSQPKVLDNNYNKNKNKDINEQLNSTHLISNTYR